MPKGKGYPKKKRGSTATRKDIRKIKKDVKAMRIPKKKNVESMGKSYIENYKNRKR